jgi:hypothetical protein
MTTFVLFMIIIGVVVWSTYFVHKNVQVDFCWETPNNWEVCELCETEDILIEVDDDGSRICPECWATHVVFPRNCIRCSGDCRFDDDPDMKVLRWRNDDIRSVIHSTCS